MRNGLQEISLAHNIEAEQCIIGSLLFDNSLYHDISAVLKKDDFYDPFHKRLYFLISKDIRDGNLCDSIVLKSRLDLEDDSLKDFDASSYIDSLTLYRRSLDTCIDYAHEIKGSSTLRNITSLSQEFLGLSTQKENGMDSNDVLTSLVSRVSEIASSESVRSSFYTAEESADSLFDGESGRIIKTGFECIDKIYPIMTKRHHILGGNTSQGKSLTGIEIALGAALNGHRVHIYSVEMSKEEIVSRMISSMLYRESFTMEYERIYRRDLRKLIEKEDWMAVLKSKESLPNNIIINDASGQTASDIISGVISDKEGMPDFVLVDYLHELSFSDLRSDKVGRTMASHEELGTTCTRLRGCSKDNDIAVMTLGQMNRDPLRRSSMGRPTKHDIEGSGKIEQGADWMGLVYRKAHYLEQKGDDMSDEERDELARCRDVMELIIAKNRMGQIGNPKFTVNLGCNNLKCHGGFIDQGY